MRSYAMVLAMSSMMLGGCVGLGQAPAHLQPVMGKANGEDNSVILCETRSIADRACKRISAVDMQRMMEEFRFANHAGQTIGW